MARRIVAIPPPMIFTYRFQEIGRLYTLTESPAGFNILPSVAKIRDTWRPKTIKAPRVIEFLINNRTEFQTGLRSVKESSRVFSGDDPRFNGRSYMLFHFTGNNSIMTIRYYHCFYGSPQQRNKINSEVINQIGE